MNVEATFASRIESAYYPGYISNSWFYVWEYNCPHSKLLEVNLMFTETVHHYC